MRIHRISNLHGNQLMKMNINLQLFVGNPNEINNQKFIEEA